VILKGRFEPTLGPTAAVNTPPLPEALDCRSVVPKTLPGFKVGPLATEESVVNGALLFDSVVKVWDNPVLPKMPPGFAGVWLLALEFDVNGPPIFDVNGQ
jgi:hypothetical protein